MKVSLKSYHDLGKCAYATLMSEFDSDKDEIRLDENKVEINNIDDLLQFLWNMPGTFYRDNVKHISVADFHSTGTWWEHRYGKLIENEKQMINKLEVRLKNAVEPRKSNILQQIENERKYIETLERIIKRLNEQMEERKGMIRHDNGL